MGGRERGPTPGGQSNRYFPFLRIATDFRSHGNEIKRALTLDFQRNISQVGAEASKFLPEKSNI